MNLLSKVRWKTRGVITTVEINSSDLVVIQKALERYAEQHVLSMTRKQQYAAAERMAATIKHMRQHVRCEEKE